MPATVWRPLLLLALLVFIDQGIKLVIHRKYCRANRVIWPGRLQFRPVQNTRHSWLGDRGVPLFGNKAFAVSTKLVVSCIFADVMWAAMGYSGAVTACTAFALARALCSLIDSAFWGGSIDYIHIKRRFTFDLKDVYLLVFIIAVVVWLFVG